MNQVIVKGITKEDNVIGDNINVTDFHKNLNEENKNLHRRIFIDFLTTSKKIQYFSKFSDNHSLEFDDILIMKNGFRSYGVEYKMDYLSFLTGNMVFELIPHINAEYLKTLVGKITSVRCGIKDSLHKKIEKCVKDCLKISNANYKISRHFEDKNPHYIFSYVMSNKKTALETKNLSDVYGHFVFSGADINKHVNDTWNSKDFIVTFTENKMTKMKWYTISSLYKVDDMKKKYINNMANIFGEV